MSERVIAVHSEEVRGEEVRAMADAAAAETTADQPGRKTRRGWVPPLGIQVLLAVVAGLVLGLAAPGFSENLKFLGDLFIRLIEMVILPLIFPLIVLAIARMGSARVVGRLAVKSIVYFEVVTTVILALTLALAWGTGIGAGTHMSASSAASTAGVPRTLNIGTMLMDIIPSNVFQAFAGDNLLAVLFFAAVFGAALIRIGEKAEPVVSVLSGVADAMFVVIGWVVRLAPLAVASYVAYSTAHYGWDLIQKLALFVAVFYVAAVIVTFLILPLVALIFRVPYFRMMRETGDLLVLAFVTRSAEAVLAPLIRRLGEFGVEDSISSFVLPLGYSFNADGATMYEGLALMFLAHVYGVHLSLARVVLAMLVLMLLTKGIAGVPSAAIVVLFAAAAAIGLPSAGVAILLAVDFVIDMARTMVNVTGNSLASMVIAKSEGKFLPTAAR
jgi:proton glutamate symport protein